MGIWGKVRLFAGGIAFGTAGIKVLTGRDAKKVYTHATAAVLRAKEEVLRTATCIKVNASDILSDAKKINEKRAADDSGVIEDASC